MFICNNISSDEKGGLLFAGQSVCALAEKYKTPLYLMDENKILENIETYKEAMNEYFADNAGIFYASKACSFKQIYRIVQSKNIGIDVVSTGEIHTAVKAGFDMSKAFFHSNNKSDEDIEFAIENNVGYFVVDGQEELFAIDCIARRKNIKQKILLRITPGIDTHTYEAVNTGKVDSKFGCAIQTGDAEEIVSKALLCENIILSGFHCHVGSQVFEEDVFERTAKIMLGFSADMQNKYSYVTRILNLGGGYGVRYVESDPEIDLKKKLRSLSEVIYSECERLGISVPYICLEPGRSIVADAGMTVYTAGSVKRIEGFKNYVSVDGGMSDNPRFALYGSLYTCYCANRINDKCTERFDLVGKCCESGDVIAEKIDFPEAVSRGDIIAVATTGAYNYSMASNYNRIPRPAVVMLKDGTDYLAVKRESLDDIVRLDV